MRQSFQNNSQPQRSLYDKWGVQPPTVENHGTEDDIARQFAEQRNRGHIWNKRGNIIFCVSCPFEHAFAVATDVMLMGTDDKGMPILDKIKISVDADKHK